MSTSEPISVVIADDGDVVRKSLRASFEARDGFSILGEARDGLEAVEQTMRLNPDVLVLDLVMPGLNGLQVLGELQKRGTSSRVILLSMHADVAYVDAALEGGACSYVLKTAPFDEVAEAVREAKAGRQFWAPPFSEQMLATYRQSREASTEKGGSR
jgi:DNA-binding NarL/FixJ family response regulator